VIIVDCESGSAGHPVLGRWEQLAREWEADYLVGPAQGSRGKRGKTLQRDCDLENSQNRY
jgi:hypothetical protein